ncbi:uncharacterized protein [Antedon mediterranea]|uniref:uncharacterized protein n=1 Tax=Antedon mediterranea TaxID=105859 RepID=UPI003AF64D81
MTSTPMMAVETKLVTQHHSSDSTEIHLSGISGIDQLSTTTSHGSASSPAPALSSSNEFERDTERKAEYESNAGKSNITIIEIDISESDDDEDEYDDDPDYDPPFNIFLCPTAALDLQETTFSEEEFEEEFYSDDEEEEETDKESSDNIKHVNIMEDSPILLNDETCLVYANCLKSLASMTVNKNCSKQTCNKPVNMNTKFIGSAIYFKWICVNGHLNNKWCSQPILNMEVTC